MTMVPRLGMRALLFVCCATATLCLAVEAQAGTFTVDYSSGHGCGLFHGSATGAYVVAAPPCSSPGGLTAPTGLIVFNPNAIPADGDFGQISTVAPSGISIIGADATAEIVFVGGNPATVTSLHNNIPYQTWADSNTYQETSGSFSSRSWGFRVTCAVASGCSGGEVDVSHVTLTASESTGPQVGPKGASNLFNQTRGYVWNPAGDPWPIPVLTIDQSGVCALSASVNGQPINGPAATRNSSAWRQCPNLGWTTAQGATVDTRETVPNAGNLTLAYRATNAAGVTSSPTHTLHVDNVPVGVSLSTPNDANPAAWVNHAVTVRAATVAGPSGIGATTCKTETARRFFYPRAGFTVNGDGAHRVSCTAVNRAIGPQGQHDGATASKTVRIDETPPATSFAPIDPADPTAVTVDAPDSESGLASASIAIQAPHAAHARALPASLRGSQVLSRFDDTGKRGVYTLIATGCDLAGNCSQSSEQLRLPVRLRSESIVSFNRLRAQERTVHRRVRVGFHLKTVRRRVLVGYHLKTVRLRRHGRTIIRHIAVGGHYKRVTRRIEVGGHVRRVTIVIHAGRRCGHRRIRTGPHRWKELSSCRSVTIHVRRNMRVTYGHRARLHGLLTTRQGAPIARAPVRILARPNDRGGVWRYATSATTDRHGLWTARLKGGPSRQIRAAYAGDATLEPATGRAAVSVPAKIHLQITPRVLPWSHTMHISGHLAGRYHPHDGVALRLLVRYPHTSQWTPLQALRTNRLGAFRFGWSYHAGRGVASYPFEIATTGRETDYPYAAGRSESIRITFGRDTPGEHGRRRRRTPHRGA